jgi:hypothetical protein
VSSQAKRKSTVSRKDVHDLEDSYDYEMEMFKSHYKQIRDDTILILECIENSDVSDNQFEEIISDVSKSKNSIPMYQYSDDEEQKRESMESALKDIKMNESEIFSDDGSEEDLIEKMYSKIKQKQTNVR